MPPRPAARRAARPPAWTANPLSDGEALQKPLYLQVAQAVQGAIADGVYAVGAMLPNEEELTLQFSVSRSTIRQAMRHLREQGLIQTRQGAGSVVLSPPSERSFVFHSTSMDDLLVFASGTRFDIEHIAPIVADTSLAARLGIAAGEEWLSVRGFWYADGFERPVTHSHYLINTAFSAVGRLLHRHKGPIFQLIEDRFAVTVTEVDEQIGAVCLTETMAAIFDVPAGSAALEISLAFRLADGTLAQIAVNTHPANRFRHAATMRLNDGRSARSG